MPRTPTAGPARPPDPAMERSAPHIDGSASTNRPAHRPSAEDIAWVGLCVSTVVLLACLVWIAPPLADLYPASGYPFFEFWEGAVHPEPLEATRWLLALGAPFLLAGLVLLGSPSPPDSRLDRPLLIFQLALIGLMVWAVLAQENGPYFPAPANYFEPLLLGIPVLAIGLGIGVVTCLLLIAGVDPLGRLDRLAPAPGSCRWPAFGLALTLTILWLLPAVVTDANVASSGQLPASHIPTWADDYFAVGNGRTPLVDYVGQYAQLIPLAVGPLLGLLDSSLTSYSVLMTLLTLVALLALFGALRLVTEKALIALVLYVPVLAISLFPWTQHGPRSEFNAIYAGFFPGRYLGPFVVAWLCALYVRTHRLPAWSLFAVAGLTALNNVEFGVPCLIALIVALVMGSDPSQPARRAIRALLRPAAIGLGAAVAAVSAVTLVRAGALPNPSLLTYFSRLFASEGFGLVPMPALGLHIPMYLTFIGALIVSAVRHVRSTHDRTATAMLAYAGVFGLLASSYFAGRSLPWQLMLLFPVWGFTLALLAWMAIPELRHPRRGPIARSFVPSCAAVTGFGIMVAAIATFPLPWQQIERITTPGPAVNDVPAVERFLEERTSPDEAIVLLGAPSDHRVAERAGVNNVSPWNSAVSVFSEREVLRALAELEEGQGTKVFLRPAGALVEELLADSGPVAEVLASRGFKRVAADRDGQVVLWRRSGV